MSSFVVNQAHKDNRPALPAHLWADHALTNPTYMNCRHACGACCIAPSITSALPGMPHGKPAGQPCAQLLPDMRCAVFGKPERPAFCAGLQASVEMCGADRRAALAWLTQLDAATTPSTR